MRGDRENTAGSGWLAGWQQGCCSLAIPMARYGTTLHFTIPTFGGVSIYLIILPKNLGHATELHYERHAVLRIVQYKLFWVLGAVIF